MDIQKKPIAELNPAAYNPRKALKPGDAEYEKLKRSITQFGYVEPVIWNSRTGNVVGGHQRLQVMKDMGATEVDVVVVDLDELKEKALNVALNKISGEWDVPKLQDLIQDLGTEGFDVSLTGFDNIEIESLFKDAIEAQVKEDDFDVDKELEKPTYSKPGDLWLLGEHRLLCGDSTKPEDMDYLMAGKKANLVVTDPPYNVEYVGKTKDALTIKNDKMDNSNFYQFLLDAYTNMERAMADDASIYVFHADTEGLNFRKAFAEAGFYLSGCCIWAKPSMVLGRSPYQWQHEPCQPPGTMVRVPGGEEIPIEYLKDGDRVMSYDKYSGVIKGYREGLPIKVASRDYDGELYNVMVDGKKTKATDNHRFTVKFVETEKKVHCVYLMRRGNWWRVGHTVTYDARGFGLKTRLRQEKGEAAWLLATFPTKIDAECGEQWVCAMFGLPYTHWETERGIVNKVSDTRSTEQIEWIYNNLDLEEMQKRAEKCLQYFGRRLEYPLITKETAGDKFSTRVTVDINACNLIPGIMALPIPLKNYEGTNTFEWKAIGGVTREYYNGPVYSLQVEKYEHYIADGIVTHNCLYGWKKKGKHQWYADRKQTTVWNFDRPSRSKDHPTMKPIPLIAYPIMNSSLSNCIVLDPFGGSGSTLIACEQTNRICHTIELDPKYCDVIVKRYAEQVGSTDSIKVLREGLEYSYKEIRPEE